MKPFADNATVVTIDTLTIDNGTQAIAIHGEVTINKDKKGLELALALQEHINNIVATLNASELPGDVAAPPATTKVRTPFS